MAAEQSMAEWWRVHRERAEARPSIGSVPVPRHDAAIEYAQLRGMDPPEWAVEAREAARVGDAPYIAGLTGIPRPD